MGGDDQLSQMIILDCVTLTDTSSCKQLCANAKQCKFPAPLCRNCYGTSSNLLRELFTDIPHNFIGTGVESSIANLLGILKTNRYALINNESAFNYYAPLQSPEFLSGMRSLCPESDYATTANPLLLVSLDEENLPQNLQYVICRDGQGNDAAYGVAVRDGIVAPMDGGILNLTDSFLK
jgi:hypothetical protein